MYVPKISEFLPLCTSYWKGVLISVIKLKCKNCIEKFNMGSQDYKNTLSKVSLEKSINVCRGGLRGLWAPRTSAMLQICGALGPAVFARHLEQDMQKLVMASDGAVFCNMCVHAMRCKYNTNVQHTNLLRSFE